MSINSNNSESNLSQEHPRNSQTAPTEKTQKRKCAISSTHANPNAAVEISSAESFERQISDSVKSLILVEFYAEWCEYCRSISALIDKLANRYRNQILILKINIDMLDEMTSTYHIQTVPTFMVWKQKEPILKFSGADEKTIISILKRLFEIIKAEQEQEEAASS